MVDPLLFEAIRRWHWTVQKQPGSTSKPDWLRLNRNVDKKPSHKLLQVKSLHVRAKEKKLLVKTPNDTQSYAIIRNHHRQAHQTHNTCSKQKIPQSEAPMSLLNQKPGAWMSSAWQLHHAVCVIHCRSQARGRSHQAHPTYIVPHTSCVHKVSRSRRTGSGSTGDGHAKARQCQNKRPWVRTRRRKQFRIDLMITHRGSKRSKQHWAA